MKLSTSEEIVAAIKEHGVPKFIMIHPKYRPNYNVLIDIQGLEALKKVPVRETDQIDEEDAVFLWEEPLFGFE